MCGAQELGAVLLHVAMEGNWIWENLKEDRRWKGLEMTRGEGLVTLWASSFHLQKYPPSRITGTIAPTQQMEEVLVTYTQCQLPPSAPRSSLCRGFQGDTVIIIHRLEIGFSVCFLVKFSALEISCVDSFNYHNKDIY